MLIFACLGLAIVSFRKAEAETVKKNIKKVVS